MTLPRISLCYACTLAIAAAGSAAETVPTVSGSGFSAVRFGMTIAEGERALGLKLQPDNPDESTTIPAATTIP